MALTQAGKPFCYNPLVWGHVNERLPMHLFSHEFVERQAPNSSIVRVRGRPGPRARARAGSGLESVYI